jgi:hypothetical protein
LLRLVKSGWHDKLRIGIPLFENFPLPCLSALDLLPYLPLFSLFCRQALYMTRLIVLTGAPASSALVWGEYIVTDSQVSQDGLAAGVGIGFSQETQPFSAQWRLLEMEQSYADADRDAVEPMPFNSPPNNTLFLTTAELTTQSHDEQIGTQTSLNSSAVTTQAMEDLDDFYDQSLVFDENLTASQLSEFQSQLDVGISQSGDGCDERDERSPLLLADTASKTRISLHLPIMVPNLYNVKDIPAAAYLQSIQPQTMSVNLVVGIMRLSQPRKISVGRRWGREREMQLLEMLVGDDTRAGFEITMWLGNSKQKDLSGGAKHQNTLESQVQKLRPRDVVLLRNLALRSYRGRVHGESLRRDVTKVDLLYRRKVDATDHGGIFSSRDLIESAGSEPVIAKTKRVRQWLMDFVGQDMFIRDQKTSTTRQALLPPDTQ